MDQVPHGESGHSTNQYRQPVPDNGSSDTLPPSKGRSIWRAALPPILHMVIQAVVYYVVLTASLLPAYYEEFVETGIMPEVTVEDILNSDATVNALLASGLVSIFLFRHMLRRNRRFFAARTPGASSQIGYVAIASIAGNFALTSAVTIIQNLMKTDMATSTLDGVSLDANPLGLLLTVCIIAPVAEEYCFRALSFNHLLRTFPFWQANIIQAVIFGLIHGNVWQIGYSFLFGLLLGWIYHRTGRFGAAVLAHIAFNTSNILLAFIPNIEALMNDTLRLVIFLFIPSSLVLFAGIKLIRASAAE